MHSELARHMLGSSLADALGIEAGPLDIRLHAILFLFVIRILNLILPWLVHERGYFGPKMVKKVRDILRHNVDTQLYPERFSTTATPKHHHHAADDGATCPFGFGK